MMLMSYALINRQWCIFIYFNVMSLFDSYVSIYQDGRWHEVVDAAFPMILIGWRAYLGAGSRR
jgi:hypothetical protein